ncbi:Hypothetical predicted protein [Mytilus galloprovincialis]|uniref:Uncharacterized protein n=1 Tax=Mytilus galloprovincialis TaxID=29158 RepID=A0A8B6CRQ3_MYTGA|nr:Hypothetical predicted protein [Mytilus galloprovincialis]
MAEIKLFPNSLNFKMESCLHTLKLGQTRKVKPKATGKEFFDHFKQIESEINSEENLRNGNSKNDKIPVYEELDYVITNKEILCAISSLKRRLFPELWSIAVMVPVFKRGDPSDLNNFRDQFQIELRNRFEVLKDGPDLDINNEWEVGRDIIKEVCENVLGRKTNKKKDWMSQGTWDKVEERRKMKEKVNNARIRAQKQEAQNKHQLLNKEVKKCCRKDKREYVNDLANEAEFAAYKGDIKTLYNITKTLSRRKTAKSKPVKDKDGKVLTNLNEQMERWNEYFVNVLNRPNQNNQ